MSDQEKMLAQMQEMANYEGEYAGEVLKVQDDIDMVTFNKDGEIISSNEFLVFVNLRIDSTNSWTASFRVMKLSSWEDDFIEQVDSDSHLTMYEAVDDLYNKFKKEMVQA